MNDNNVTLQNHINTTLSAKDLFGLLSKPLRVAVSIALAITGLSMFSFFTVAARFEELVKRFGTVNLSIDVAMVVLFVLIIISLVSGLFLASISIVALVRLKLMGQNFESDITNIINDFSTNISQLDFEVKQLVLSKYILDEDQITALESSKRRDERIIVMTSKYHLDTGKLLEIILSNIKKGVIYQYVVPGEKTRGTNSKIKGKHHADFIITYTNWWNSFKEDLLKSEPPEIMETYHPDYKRLKEEALYLGLEQLSNAVKEKAQKYFASHVQEFLVNKDYSLVTIIMYQKGAVTDHNYDIIMKLPTISDDNYYAFKIPDEEKVEKQSLSNIIEAFCREESIKLTLN